MPKKTANRPAGQAAEKKETDKGVEVVQKHSPEISQFLDPFSRLGLSEWFDRWPELFARRWPESFRGIPFVDEGFRMEQFVEDDGTLVVRGELPGLDVDKDITITLDDGRLTIAAEREERSEDSTNGRFHSEFHYGSLRRTVRLPAGARGENVEATYADGILEVRVPVDTEAEKATKIPIVKKR